MPVETWFLAAPHDIGRRCHSPATPAETSIRREALKWVAQVRCARWIREENQVRKRVASSPDAALHYVQAMQDFGEGDVVEALRVSASSVRRRDKRLMLKWCQRFRSRWHITRTRLAVRDVLTRADLDTKACGPKDFCLAITRYPMSCRQILHSCMNVACGFRYQKTAPKVEAFSA